MPSDLYQNFGGNPVQNSSPREQAMRLLHQRGINIPEGLQNNPNAILQHLMQSGQIPQNRLQMAQSMMQRMIRR